MVLEQCQHTLEQMQNADLEAAGDEERGGDDGERLGWVPNEPDSSQSSVADDSDQSDEV